MFKEPSIKFSADMKLIVMLMSSLKLEPADIMIKTNGGNMIRVDKVSTGIYFIERGLVTVSYKSSGVLCKLSEGSYFGEISYLFQVRNRYHFKL